MAVRVVVVGGGLAGCGAALAARKAGAEVSLLERSDMLAGVAVRTGDTRGNGWFVGQHELNFLGGGELGALMDSIKMYEGVKFPDAQKHAFIFNTGLIEPRLRRALQDAGITVHLKSRAMDVVKEKDRLRAIKLEDGRLVEGEGFVDCTGTRGGLSFCIKYGKGCVMCLIRCCSFGDRVSMVEKAGGKEWHRIRGDGTPGRISTGLAVFKDTLAPWLKEKLQREGLMWIPVPPELVDLSKLGSMGAGRSREFVENLIIGNIGPVAKIFGFLNVSLVELRRIPGFENVHIEHPGSARCGHVSAIAMAFRDSSLKVDGFENLFCAGDKAGETSVDAAMLTGYVAGHNAARRAAGRAPLILPRNLALGDWMAFAAEKYCSGEAQRKASYVMSRGEYWERMQQTGLYTTDVDRIRKRVEEAGLTGVMSSRVV
ncbi:MAG: FAD-dependent oxidoreductase [Dehalococcoidia bacterium]|nr:FAD-dependent oxidoreductase [Dehalococcoidia bacterium]